jgi:hypothetical protein
MANKEQASIETMGSHSACHKFLELEFGNDFSRLTLFDRALGGLVR